MEFKRDRVFVLYLSGKPQVAIIRTGHHLNVNKSFVSRTIARYHDTGSVALRPKSGRKKKGNNIRHDRKGKGQI